VIDVLQKQAAVMSSLSVSVPKSELLDGYPLGLAFDEMFERDGSVRPHYEPLFKKLSSLSSEEFRRRKAMTDLSMLQDGVGFTVYQREEGIERIWPIGPDSADHPRQGMGPH